MRIAYYILLIEKIEMGKVLINKLNDKHLKGLIKADAYSKRETKKALWSEVDKRRKGNPNFMR